MHTSIYQKVLDVAHELRMVRPQDIAALGIHPMYLQRLYERGELIRLGRGVYIPADSDYSQNISLAEACKRVPHGVVCLLSALQFHNLGTQNPHQVWMAIHPKKGVPRIKYPPLRIVRYSGLVLSEGVEEHKTSDGLVNVYSIAKTVADCFRYRNKIGLEVALEALRECRRERRATLDELWHFAAVDKVSTVMRPYLESVT